MGEEEKDIGKGVGKKNKRLANGNFIIGCWLLKLVLNFVGGFEKFMAKVIRGKGKQFKRNPATGSQGHALPVSVVLSRC